MVVCINGWNFLSCCRWFEIFYIAIQIQKQIQNVMVNQLKLLLADMHFYYFFRNIQLRCNLFMHIKKATGSRLFVFLFFFVNAYFPS